MLVDQHIDCLWPRRNNNPWSVNTAEPYAVGESQCESPVGRKLSSVYDPILLKQAARIAVQLEVNLQRGTYISTLGPTYETRSEYRMFRWMGGDAVGMSTVPEVMTARQAGMRVLAMSVITNVACTDQAQGTTHEEVVQQGKEIEPKLRRLVHQLLQEWPAPLTNWTAPLGNWVATRRRTVDTNASVFDRLVAVFTKTAMSGMAPVCQVALQASIC